MAWLPKLTFDEVERHLLMGSKLIRSTRSAGGVTRVAYFLEPGGRAVDMPVVHRLQRLKRVVSLDDKLFRDAPSQTYVHVSHQLAKART